MSRSLLEKIVTAAMNPGLTGRVVNRNARRLFRRWNHAENGIDFFDEDWDNLLILDACRYDAFVEQSTLPGDLGSRVSNASNTVEFLENNFDGRDLRDTVYVTANGQLANYRDDLDVNLHAVEPLYATAWDDNLGTVPAGPVVEAAKEAARTYPNKRLLVHFVQPHIPFVESDTTDDKDRNSEFPFWVRFRMGNVDMTTDEIKSAYRANLDYVLPYAGDLVEALDGKTVVSSDHGNVFGERARPLPVREWGHPKGVYAKELVTVPWLKCPYDERREVVAEDGPELRIDADPAVVEDRLRALGYR